MPSNFGNIIAKEIQLHYCSGIRNFGDELSPYLISKITGKKVTQASSCDGLYAIGSVLTREALRSNCVIWGTGTLHREALSIRLFPLKRSIPAFIQSCLGKEETADCRAVRGPLTRKAILAAGGKCPEVYGDPAIVVPRFYTPKIKTTYQAGLILHHTQETERTNSLAKSCGFQPISIERMGGAQLEEFINEVCSCEKVFSSSLHGVIIAQAYGIPAQWIQVLNTPIHKDEGHKFEDYFLGVNLPVQKPLLIELTTESLSRLKEFTPQGVHISTKIIDQLLDVFPFDTV